MPHFYFDVHDGARFIPDDQGFNLNSLEAAEHEATQTAIQLGRQWLPSARQISVMVRDERHRPVLALTLTLTAERLVPRRDWA
jgi:hypothetical protein